MNQAFSRFITVLCTLALLTALFGCHNRHRVSPELKGAVEAKTGMSLDAQPQKSKEITKKLLSKEIRCVDAAQIALLNNPDFLDKITGARSLSPLAELTDVASLAIQIITEVKTNCIELKSAFEVKAAIDELVKDHQAMREQLRRKLARGELSKVALHLGELQYARTKREALEISQLLEILKERLSSLMGLQASSTAWGLKRGILPLPNIEPDFAALEASLQKSTSANVNTSLAELRIAVSQMQGARTRFDYTSRLILPLAGSIVAEAQNEFESNLATASQVLQAKRDYFETRRDLIFALKDYWIARAQLEKAVGGIAKKSAKP